MQQSGNDNMAKQQMEFLNNDLELASNKGDDEEGGGADFDGIDDKCMHCFLQAGLQTGTLRTEISEKDCTFLVNLINQEKNQKAIPYEAFIDFLIPQTNKKVSTRLLKKIKRKDIYDIKQSSYDIYCALAKLLECEVQIKKKVQRQI